MSANNAEEYSQCLTTFVSQYLSLIPNFNEDVNYVAEYIVLLMSNGGTVQSIATELQSLFDSTKPEDIEHVVAQAFEAVQQLNNGASTEQVLNSVPQSQQQEQPQPQPQQLQSQQQQQQQTAPVAPAAPVAPVVSAAPAAPAAPAAQGFQFQFNTPAPTFENSNEDTDMQAFEPTDLNWKRERQNHNNRDSRFGGVQKGGNVHKNNKNTNSRFDQKGNNNNNRMMKMFTKLPLKEGRCKDFPDCPLNSRECPGSHPTIICALYPNCERKNKTCSFLHPDEDQDMIELLKKKKIEYQEKKEKERQVMIEKKRMITSGITLCKFGAVCANPKCPFGHPTPCNDMQKVSEYIWCPGNLDCQDENCQKAHSSPARIKDIQPLGKPTTKPSFRAPAAERTFAPIVKSLEQCKYGLNCTNKKCKFRHAKSATMCREGAACTRIDCIFGHPIPEACRFGVNCTNKACLFQHPEGRNIPSTTWVNPDTTGTVGAIPTQEQQQSNFQEQQRLVTPTGDAMMQG